MADWGENSSLLGNNGRERHFCNKTIPLWSIFVIISSFAIVTCLACLIVHYSTKSAQHYAPPVVNTRSSTQNKQNSNKYGRGCYITKKELKERKISKRSWEEPNFEQNLPKELNWCDMDGVSYCSPVKNQHIPVYCGSCWAHGSSNAIADRFNVHSKQKRWTEHTFSTQEIIDCSGAGCGGGHAEIVYRHAMTKGLVDETCNVYQARDGPCTKFNRCGTCFKEGVCDALTNYTIYKVKEYGYVKGREQMMAEIQHGGPISCGMAVTDYFDMNYTGGVYAEKTDKGISHVVEVVGWGVQKGIEHWIVKNSWGTPWGEKGFFRMVTSKYKDGTGNEYNSLIETDCSYVIPDIKAYSAI